MVSNLETPCTSAEFEGFEDPTKRQDSPQLVELETGCLSFLEEDGRLEELLEPLLYIHLLSNPFKSPTRLVLLDSGAASIFPF